MSAAKPQPSEIPTRSDDCEIIPPKIDLRKKVRKLTGAQANFDPIQRAEQAIQQLSINFSLWLDDNVNKMEKTWGVLQKEVDSKEKREAFFRAVHDIKGQAATFGYAMAGEAAGTLCDLLESLQDKPLPLDLVITHINAIKAIIREGSVEESNTARALILELRMANNYILQNDQEDSEDTGE